MSKKNRKNETFWMFAAIFSFFLLLIVGFLRIIDFGRGSVIIWFFILTIIAIIYLIIKLISRLI